MQPKLNISLKNKYNAEKPADNIKYELNIFIISSRLLGIVLVFNEIFSFGCMLTVVLTVC